MKYILSVFGFLMPFIALGQFSDIAASHPHADAIEYAYDEGLVDGYPDGTYKPDQTINRAEFVKIALEAEFEKRSSMHEPISFTYADVLDNEWYSTYIAEATGRGIVSGYPDGTFRPANPVNYAEAAKILSGIYDLPLRGINYDHYEWYGQYFMRIDGMGARPRWEIAPEDLLTRGEMAEMIYVIETTMFADEFGFGKMLPEDCYADEEYDADDKMCYIIEEYADEDDYSDALTDSEHDHWSHENDLPEGTLYGIVDDEINLIDGETYPADEMIWGAFINLVPAQYRTNIAQLLIYEGEDDTLAFVSPLGETNEQWVLAVNIWADMFTKDEEVADMRDFQQTLIHEFAHVLTLNDTQIYPAEERRDCPNTYFTDEGCTNKEAILNQFVHRFWHHDAPGFHIDNEFGSDFYAENKSQFINEYAATNPVEDLAESFLHFVYAPKPTGDLTVAQQKMNFFYDFPSLVKLRKDLREGIKVP